MLRLSSSGEEVYELFEDEDYVLNVDLFRMNRLERGLAKGSREVKAHTPKFPKPKDENWIVVLGNGTDLAGLKRLSAVREHQSMHISFRTPELEPEESSSPSRMNLTLFFMSDVYLGLDQQYEIKFNVRRSKTL